MSSDIEHRVGLDLEIILEVDPGNKDAISELASLRSRLEEGEQGLSTGASDDGDPRPDAEKIDPDDYRDSDSSDCEHVGNGIPCKFYNHDGCLKGEHCSYSHAPDEMSARDKL
jgi:hypothetical protein